jgi:23S rRNA (guanosine2251-2'-O)-methyltransferase
VSPARKRADRPAGKGSPKPKPKPKPTGTPKSLPKGGGRSVPAARGPGRPTPAGKGGTRGRGTAADRSYRRTTRGLGGDQVEGRQAVRELLLAGRRRVRELLVAEDHDDLPGLQDIVDIALDLHVPVRQVSANRLRAEARTEAPQGVVARAAPLPETDLDDLAAVWPGRPAPFLVALDGVTDPGNLGAVLRSAEGAGATGVVLPRHRAAHVTPTAAKAAAGAIEYLPMAVVGGLPAALGRLRELGVWVVGLDAGGDRELFDLPLDPDQPVVLVLGAEGSGLSRLVRQRCDVVASIPLLGHLASLNVSVAGALACYEVTRRRRVPR